MYKTKNGRSSVLAGAAAFLMVFICIAAAFLIFSGKLGGHGGEPGGTGAAAAGTPANSSEALGIVDEDLEDPAVKEIMAHADEYTPELIKLFRLNPDARDFVLGYPEHKNDGVTGGLEDKEISSGDVPLLLQWDPRWGYSEYGSGPLGITGCGPTCLSMVLTALTDKGDYPPDVVAAYSLENGYYVDGSGTKWSLMTDGAAGLGLTSQEVPLWEDSMVQALNEGKPIIVNVGEGDFTENGHYIVLTGYSDGAFTVNDPNSNARSERTWTYSELEGQIRAMWSFSI